MVMFEVEAVPVWTSQVADVTLAGSPGQFSRSGEETNPTVAEVAGDADGSIPSCNPGSPPAPTGFVPGYDYFEDSHPREESPFTSFQSAISDALTSAVPYLGKTRRDKYCGRVAETSMEEVPQYICSRAVMG
jgi:hypothetical protein